MKRENWEPTKHSRLCSTHFNDNCFFLKKGTRLRLLSDAVPTIFNFRKIKNNRKKVKENSLSDMDEHPDSNSYDAAEIVLNHSSICVICRDPCNSADMTVDSVVCIKQAKVQISHIIDNLFGKRVISN